MTLFKYGSLLLLFLLLTCSENGVKPKPVQDLCTITDSTSHNVSWRVDTIGVFPSVLFDVAAIDAQNVWAVGEIERMENGEKISYNAVKWNGKEYKYYRLDSGAGAPSLRVILDFNKNDFWLFGQNRFTHWNGSSFTHGVIPLGMGKGSTKAAWGTSSEDFYLVGDNGSISHYNGSSFTLMESNTDVDLFEIDGFIDEKTGKKHIWALGNRDGKAVVLAYKDGTWSNIWDMDLLGNYRFPQGIYISDSKTMIMSVWSGLDQKGRLYCFDPFDLKRYVLLKGHNTWTTSLAARSKNDIFITGAFNSIEHFNGNTFLQYKPLMANDYYYNISLFKNNVYAVGTEHQIGLFAHGKR